MKRIGLTIVVVLFVGVLAYQYGGGFVTQRHRVANFQWKLPADKPVKLSDSLVVDGIELALRTGVRDAGSWQPVPVSSEPGASIICKGQNQNAGLVILTNRNSGAQLYARVEIDEPNRVLNVVISRPK